MTNLIEPSAPHIEVHACPACGTWVCNDCGARRPYASRFSEQAQHCASCRSLNGQMTPSCHRAGRADDHAAAYQAGITSGLGLDLRYPLEPKTALT